jgi:hypothetical protein
MSTGRSLGPLGVNSFSGPDSDQSPRTGVATGDVTYSSGDPIGSQGDDGAIPLDNTKQAGANKGSATATKELNIVGGGFDWDPPISGPEEIAKLTGNLWSPGTKDFVAVVNAVSQTASTADSFGGFLGAIVISAPGSIKRINLLTHANPDIISFSGSMNSNATVGRDVTLSINSPGSGSTMVSLDTQSIKAIAAPAVIFNLPNNKKDFTITDIRGRFAPDAMILLLACHSGVLATFLQDIANFFRVTVVGFTQEIAYCPPPQTNPKAFIRAGMQIGVGSCANKAADYRTFSSLSNAVRKVPAP